MEVGDIVRPSDDFLSKWPYDKMVGIVIDFNNGCFKVRWIEGDLSLIASPWYESEIQRVPATGKYKYLKQMVKWSNILQ